MIDKNQLKREGLMFGRTLQRAYKLVVLYTADHVSAEEPVQRCYDALSGLLRQTPQFTFGFYNRRVVLNELLTPDSSLDALEDDFFKRGIAAVTFILGITPKEFKRGIGIIGTKPDTIEQTGGISAFIKKNSVEGMRIIPADRRPSLTGDTMLGTDLQSMMMAHTLLDVPTGSRSAGLDLLLQSAGMTSQTALGGSAGEVMELVGKATQAAWTNPASDPKQAILALARLLEELTPEYLISALPSHRQSELMGRPAGEVASEIAEDSAIDWAKNRWASAQDQEEAGGRHIGAGGIAEAEVIRVLGRALQTTQVAERLLQKLAKLVGAGELPSEITDRIQHELQWSSWTLPERHAHLVGLTHFAEQDFRHLVEYLKETGQEGSLDQGSAAAQHYLTYLDAAPAAARTEGLARLPELIRILTGMHSLDFVRQVADRFCGELARPASDNWPLHQAVAASVAAAAQSLAMFEDFESALKIGGELERSVASDPEQHAECCAQALHSLLNTATVERLIQASFQKRIDVKFSRAIASLLRMVDVQAAEIVFRMLEEERSASGRARLLHVVRQLGDGAFRAARKRLEDERWYVVRNACYVLGALNDPDLASHLEPALRHPDARVQQAAVTAILRSSVANRGAILVSVLPTLPPHLQETVLDELLLLKDPTAIDPLEGFLLRGGGAIKTGILEKALRTLTVLPDERVVEVLSSVLLHAEAPLSLRRSALVALKNSSHASARQRLAQFRLQAPTDPLAKE